ncbi:hypothetical protein D1007_28755 [Hordeum vulgare]|nr:hypothetical protein D1007_28755 [Hordeum vulgare]
MSKSWMKELRSVAYQADDVLDDFQYEALRRQSKIGKSTTRKALSYITRHSPLLFRFEMSRKLKNVLKKINKLVKEMNTFGLESSVRREEQQHLWRQTHSKLDETTQIFGRDGDKEVMVKLLLDQQDQRRVQVLPIIGMGGLGKTTLAKMVYNNQGVQQHFELKMWHCVSDNFDSIALLKSIIELAISGRCDMPDTIELLQKQLEQVIGQKRFMLVLDDVWNEDERKWEDVLKPLLCSVGGPGSLPEDMAKLRKLIYLYLCGCASLKSMSPNFGLLNNLHILTTFIVGSGDGLGIEQLRDLENLSNRLELLNLNKIKSGENAKEANLSQKKNLKRMDNLTTLCNKLDVEAGGFITPLRTFPGLKRMELVQLPSLEMWAENSMGEPSCDNLVTFPMLEELEIKNCPKLASIPVIPVVSKLSIVGVHSSAVGMVFMRIRLGSWPFLVSLTLGSLEDIPMLPLDAQQSQSQRPLEKLESLILEGPNSSMRSSGLSGSPLMVWKCFRFVRNLTIDGCRNLISWPTEELRCMDRLSVLRIMNCRNLEGNTSSSEEETLPLSLEYLTIEDCRSVVAQNVEARNLAKLRRLWVENCMSLKVLPDGMCDLTSLRELRIRRCRAL